MAWHCEGVQPRAYHAVVARAKAGENSRGLRTSLRYHAVHITSGGFRGSSSAESRMRRVRGPDPLRHAHTLFRSVCLAAAATGILATTLVAQIRPRVSDSFVFKGAIQPVTRPTLMPPPPPMTKAASPPPRPVAAIGISGMEVVAGPIATVAALAITSASAQCPTGKVALSAGVEFTAPGQASFGLEVKGAWPVWNDARLATVSVRNANVFVPARVRAFAVCVTEIPGLRRASVGGLTTARGDDPVRIDGSYNANERVVGGGVMGESMTIVTSNAPDGVNPGAGVWHQIAMPASPVRLPGTYGVQSIILCAPATAVDGWALVTSVPVSLGASSQSALSTSCPPGKVLLAAGVLQSSSNYIDIVANTMIPTSNGSASANIHNRNIPGAGGNVNARVSVLCARKQWPGESIPSSHALYNALVFRGQVVVASYVS